VTPRATDLHTWFLELKRETCRAAGWNAPADPVLYTLREQIHPASELPVFGVYGTTLPPRRVGDGEDVRQASLELWDGALLSLRLDASVVGLGYGMECFLPLPTFEHLTQAEMALHRAQGRFTSTDAIIIGYVGREDLSRFELIVHEFVAGDDGMPVFEDDPAWDVLPFTDPDGEDRDRFPLPTRLRRRLQAG
jgi:hypothetical protein